MDQYLEKTIQHLAKHWFEADVGIVAAGLIDGANETYATSYRNGPVWYHAERNAYDLFQKKYGEPSKNAVFVSTLSPCIDDLKYRKEYSCCTLISSLGIQKIYFGVLDTHHTPSLDTYKQLGFHPTLTQNEKLHAICKKLMQLFAQYESRINTDLIGIKKELGPLFFDI